MLRESSISTPRKFCWGTTDDSTSTGRRRQNASSASVEIPQHREDRPVERSAVAAHLGVRAQGQETGGGRG